MEDLDIDENIFRPDVSSIKVKITRTKPNPVSTYDIDTPK